MLDLQINFLVNRLEVLITEEPERSQLQHVSRFGKSKRFPTGYVPSPAKPERLVVRQRGLMRQGDVLLFPTEQEITGTKLNHLVLAKGEVTGHRHRIREGKAELYERDGILYLRVLSPKAILSHEEHYQIDVPKGNWEIRIQREYEPNGWNYVAD